MKRHKLNFGNRTVLEQLEICRRVADGIAGLSEEQRATLPPNDVTTRADEAAQAHVEVESLKIALKAALTRRNDKLRAARDSATNAASGIVAATAGDPAVMLAAGLDIVRDKQPVGLPAAPAQLRAQATEFEGKVQLRWKRSVRRCRFDVEATADPAARTGWQRQLTCFKQSCSVTGLKSEAKYWFRVAASNAHGQGPWSQPVSVRVK